MAYVSANGWTLLPADPDVAELVSVASVEDFHRISYAMFYGIVMGILWDRMGISWENMGRPSK